VLPKECGAWCAAPRLSMWMGNGLYWIGEPNSNEGSARLGLGQGVAELQLTAHNEVDEEA
jgi:hypothetical protein